MTTLSLCARTEKCFHFSEEGEKLSVILSQFVTLEDTANVIPFQNTYGWLNNVVGRWLVAISFHISELNRTFGRYFLAVP